MAQDWKDSLPKKRLSKRFKFSSGGAQSLGNTGTGENGRLEPSKPVAMFQTADGPRMVHEGEDMQKLPNGDIQVIPASQSQLGQLERRGVKGYALGGTMRSHGGGHHDAFLGSQSGVSSNPFKATPEQQTVDAPTLNLGAPVANAPAPQQTVDIAPPQQQRTVGLGLDVGAPVTTSNTAAGDVTPTTTTPTVGESAVARGLGGLEAIAAGESPVDRTIANRTLGNLGAQQEAERMAAIQAQAQQGVSGPAAQAQQAMLGITQGSQMGQVAGELAQGAQQRAQQAVRDLLAGGQAQQRFEFDKEKYGDEEFTRMATDIANGMTFEQAKQKYPNLSREDYESTRGTVLFEQDRARLEAARDDVGTWVDQMVTSDPEWMSSGKWMTDPQMQARLTNLWKEEGMDGEYNPNNAAHQAWAQTQIAPYTVTPEEAEINRVRNSTWYQGLDPDEQNEVDDLLDFAATISVTQGYQLGQNTDGSTYIMNADNEVVYGSRTNDPGAAPGLSSEDVNGFIDAMADNGITVSPSRARQYMNEHPGEGYPTLEEFNVWNSSAADISNIMDYFNGEPDAILSTADVAKIDEIKAAQLAVDAGTATDEQKQLLARFPVEFADGAVFEGGKMESTDDFRFYVSKYGNLHRHMEYNNEIYRASSQEATFTSEMTEWINQNAGRIVQIDGTYYRISATNPIVNMTIQSNEVTSGNDSRTFGASVQGLKVVNVESGVEETLTFGAKYRVED